MEDENECGSSQPQQLAPCDLVVEELISGRHGGAQRSTGSGRRSRGGWQPAKIPKSGLTLNPQNRNPNQTTTLDLREKVVVEEENSPTHRSSINESEERESGAPELRGEAHLLILGPQH